MLNQRRMDCDTTQVHFGGKVCSTGTQGAGVSLVAKSKVSPMVPSPNSESLQSPPNTSIDEFKMGSRGMDPFKEGDGSY